MLTQDLARQFLNSSSEAEKYKFFIKGVQLEQLDHDYILLADSLDSVNAHHDTIKEDVEILNESAKKAFAKYELSLQQETLRVRWERLSRQMAWAQVEEVERVWITVARQE